MEENKETVVNDGGFGFGFDFGEPKNDEKTEVKKEEKKEDKIMKGLDDGSKNYFSKLKTLNKNYYSYSKPNNNYSCESCLIF